MKYILLLIFSTNFLFAYTNIGLTSMDGNTTAGFNTYNGTVNIGTIKMGTPSQVVIPIYMRTNQITDIFNITSSIISKTIGSNVLKQKGSYYNSQNTTTTDLVYGSTTYNSEVEIWNSSFNEGIIPIGNFILDFDGNLNKRYLAGSYSQDIVLTFKYGSNTSNLTLTINFDIEEYVNIKFGSTNLNTFTSGLNVDNHSEDLGTMSVEEVNNTNVYRSIYLNTNSNSSITMTGISAFFYDGNNNQYTSDVKFRELDGTFQDIALGNNSSSFDIWNGGISNGDSRIGHIFINHIFGYQSNISAGDSSTIVNISITIN